MTAVEGWAPVDDGAVWVRDGPVSETRHRLDVVATLVGGVVAAALVLAVTALIAHVLVIESRDHRANVASLTAACDRLPVEADRVKCLAGVG